MSIVLGIDPGLNGAFAVVGPGSMSVYDMPTFNMVVNRKDRKRLDVIEVIKLAETFSVLGVELAVLEAVGGRPKQSASAAYVFGYSVGLVYMALAQARIPVETVQPGVWKKIMKLPGKVPKLKDTEGMSDDALKAAKKSADKDIVEQIKNRANEVFPAHRNLFYGAKGGVKLDRIEAAMLAEFGRRHVLNSVSPDAEWRLTYQKASTGA